MKVMGLIPARGGSKGIPRKNLALFCGRTLLEHTIDCALHSTLANDLFVSTDDAEIASRSLHMGISVIHRPAELAQDDTPTIDVVRHAVSLYGDGYDAVFTLQVTNPLRIPQDIDGACRALRGNQPGRDAVVGCSDVGERHPHRMFWINHDEIIFNGRASFERRQKLPQYFLRNGNVYLTRIASLEAPTLLGYNPMPYIIPPERSWSVDEPMDLVICEALYKCLLQKSTNH